MLDMFDENSLISINKCIGFFSYFLFGPLKTKKNKKWKTVGVGWGKENEAKKEYDLVLGMKVISIN